MLNQKENQEVSRPEKKICCLPFCSKPTCKVVCFVILGLVLLAVAVFAGIQIGKKQAPPAVVQQPEVSPTPTVDPTANWKTILNEQIGIFFKYPESLFPYINTPQIVPDYSYFGFNAFNNKEKRDHRALTKTDLELELAIYKPIKVSIQPYLSAIEATDNTIITQPFPGISGSYTKVKTVTDGTAQKAIIYTEPENEYADYDGIVVDGKNVATIRLMTGSRNRRQELLPLLDLILSTFKFLDGESLTTNSCSKDVDKILETVTKFEEYQKKRDSSNVLNLFTPPEYQTDIEIYNYLSGKDNNVALRLYSTGETNFNLLSYKIVKDPESRGSKWCVVVAEENRQYYRQGIGGYLEPKLIKIELLLVKSENNWKIDQYIKTNQPSPAKYSGWVGQ